MSSFLRTSLLRDFFWLDIAELLWPNPLPPPIVVEPIASPPVLFIFENSLLAVTGGATPPPPPLISLVLWTAVYAVKSVERLCRGTAPPISVGGRCYIVLCYCCIIWVIFSRSILFSLSISVYLSKHNKISILPPAICLPSCIWFFLAFFCKCEN